MSRFLRGTIAAALLALAGAGCDAGPPSNYTIVWIFTNNSNASAVMTGIDAGHSSGGTVAAHSTTAPSTSTDLLSGNALPVTITVVAGGTTKTTTSTVPIGATSITTITVIWDGADIDVHSSVRCKATLRATGGGIVAPHSEDGCDAPVRWQLAGVTGAASGSWQDGFGSATGSLTFSPPQSIEEGEVVPVTATFTGSVTEAAGWARNASLSVGIADYGSPGISVNNVRDLGTANLSASGSVTVTGQWTVPSNATTISIQAGGNILQGGPPNSQLNRVATYTKVP